MKERGPSPFSFSEMVAAMVIIALSTALGLAAYYLYKARNIGPAIVFGGLDMILLAGVFDPINALWLLIPFTSRPLVKRPYSLEHRILRRAGFLVAIAGIVSWYEGNAWVMKIVHTLRHTIGS